MFFITIKNPGWQAFSGDFCGYQFKDGTSIDPLPRNICDRISGLVVTELTDADGETQGQGGAAARIASRRGLATEVVAPMARMTDDDKDAEQKQAFLDAGDSVKRVFYTQEQLENVATLEGIAGLRLIAKPWSVKDRSIPKLIHLIVKAQNHFAKIQEERLQEERTARAAAGDAAMAEQLRLEEEAMKSARVLVRDETPNAVGPNGEPTYVAPPANKFVPAPNVDESAKVEVIAAIVEAAGENAAANEAEHIVVSDDESGAK